MNEKIPSPIDYYNPLARPQPADLLPDLPPRPATVVPMEFDAVLSHSADHGALAAIETALRVRHIASFRADDGQLAGREITLYVRSADHDAAALIAAGIFARRQRVRTVIPPMQNPDPAFVEGAAAGRFGDTGNADD